MANKKLNATITIGGALAASLAGAFNTVKRNVGEVGAAIRRLEGEQRMLASGIRTFGEMGKNVDSLRAKYDSAATALERLRKAQDGLDKAKGAQQQNDEYKSELQGDIVETVIIGAALSVPIVEAVKFETAMLGVSKQVAGARDAGGNLTQVYWDMARQVQVLGRSIPIATNEIAEMVAAGARMGVANDELVQFTKTSAMMAEAFEMPAAELADSMGKIAGLFKIPIPQIGALADSINYLDDNAISKGADIIDFLTRTGGASSAVKVTGQEMAALGSTLLTLGERTETAGTATNALFAKFAAADKGTKKFKSAMAEIGLSTAEVQDGMQVDTMGTIMKVMDAVGKLPKKNQLGVLVELVGLEHADTLAKLANNTGEFKKQLEMANSEMAKGSMSKEFEARMKTVGARWKLTNQAVVELAVSMGTVLLPPVNKLLFVFNDVVIAMSDFSREHPLLTKVVLGGALALVGMRLAVLGAAWSLAFLKGGVLRVMVAMAGMRVQAALAAANLRMFGAAGFAANGGLAGFIGRTLPMMAAGIRAVGVALVTTPIGVIVAGIAVAGLLIYRYWDGVKAFLVGTFDGVVTGLAPLVQTFKAFGESLTPLKPLFDLIGSALSSAWTWFTNLLGPVSFTKDELGKAGAAGKSFGETLAAGINFVLTPLNLLITGLTWVANNIGGILDKAVSFKNAVGDGVGGAWQGAKNFFGAGEEEKPAGGDAVGKSVAPMMTPMPVAPKTPMTLAPAPMAPKAPVAMAPKAPVVGEALSTNKKSIVESGAFARSMESEVPGLPGNIKLPTIPPMAGSRASGSTYEDKSTTTIQVTQNPGEDGKALARRVVEEQERARKVRQRGAMHDGTVTQ